MMAVVTDDNKYYSQGKTLFTEPTVSLAELVGERTELNNRL
jgi:hypothetical protein